jgi:uncharacterized protein YpuA (DUF1002 family)
MDLIKLLETNSDKIISEAYKAVQKDKLKGYSKVGQEKTKTKLTNLFKKVQQCVKKKELIPMLNYTEKIAKERFSSGYDLFEVQTAINSLEVAIWSIIFKEVKPEKLAEYLGLISTVLGAGKDHLARTYVSLATKSKAPSLNLQNLFAGSESIANEH